MSRHYAVPNINIIDRESSFWLWRQAGKPPFNDTIALFVG